MEGPPWARSVEIPGDDSFFEEARSELILKQVLYTPVSQ